MIKKEYKNILILFSIILLIIIIPSCFNLFGSDTDWLNQHTIIPEYFRQTFYKTGNLIPNFSLNYGSGQNIFNLAYYGLLSPIILLSYLFPFIKMQYYIIAINIIILFVTVFLFYKWLRSNKFNERMSLLVSLIFITSGPIIFHMHRHIMFVNYMPFLIMGLMGVDRLFKSDKKILLISSTFLMIMTSFYYSVGGILVLFLYYIFKITKYKTINKKEITKKILMFVFYMMVSIFMAGILLLPTMYTVLQTRGTNNYNLLKLLIPDVEPTKILYGAYSLGLTCIAFISLLWCVYINKRNYRILGIVLLIIFFIPLFTCLLNGGLYFRAKVFIPFIPLICMLIGIFLKNLFGNKIDIKKLVVFLIMVNILVIISGTTSIIYYIDFISLIILLMLYKKIGNKKIIYIPIILLSIFSAFYINFTEQYISNDEYNTIFNENIDVVSKNIDSNYRVSNLVNSSYTVNKIYNNSFYTTNIYSSTYNDYYYNFSRNEFKINNPYYNSFLLGSVNNILFNTYMGNKYLISEGNPGMGYTLVDSANSIGLYQNDLAYSIGYVNSNTISDDYYNSLSYPYNVEALLNNVVVNNNNYSIKPSNIEKIKLKYSTVTSGVDINKEKNKYKIEVTKSGIIDLFLTDDMKNKILLIDFSGLKPNKCDEQEISITINGIKNSLTCDTWIYPNNNTTFHYVISQENLNKLHIEFSKGIYTIEDINIYTLNYDTLKKNYDEFIIDKVDNNGITGNVNVTNDGYFVLSIPYDNGFTIYVDDVKTDYELVNKSFMGFKINSGNHNIKIVYTSPWLKEGIYISLFGLVLFLGIIGRQVEKKKMFKR